jgi:hypothetical protein
MLPRRRFEHRIVEAGNDDRGNRRCRTYQQLQSIERTEADICDEQVRREAAHDPRTVLKSSDGYGAVACIVYELRQENRSGLIVIHNEHAFGVRTGAVCRARRTGLLSLHHATAGSRTLQPASARRLGCPSSLRLHRRPPSGQHPVCHNVACYCYIVAVAMLSPCQAPEHLPRAVVSRVSKIAREPEAVEQLKEAQQGQKQRCHLTDRDVRARNSAKKESNARFADGLMVAGRAA